MKKRILLSSVLSIFILGGFNGCSEHQLSPKSVDIKKIKRKMSENNGFKFNIKKGETIAELVQTIKTKFPERTIIFKINKKIMNMKFKESIKNFSLNDLKYYLKEKENKLLTIKKYSSNLYTISIEDIKSGKIIEKSKMDIAEKELSIFKNKKIEISRGFKYLEIFNMIQGNGVRIDLDIKEDDFYNKESFAFKGTLNDYLISLSKKEHLFITKITKHSLTLSDFQTKVYQIDIPVLDNINQSSVTNNQGGGLTSTGLSSNNRTTTSIVTENPAESLDNQIKAIVKNNENYYLDKVSGTLSISAGYNTIELVDKLIENFKKIYGKSIKLELNIYKVTLNNSHEFGVNYEVLKNNLIGSMDLNLKTATSILDSTAGSVSLSDNIIKIDSEGTTTNTQISQSIFKFLNKFGKATVVTKPTLGTVNNLSVNLDIINSVDYISKMETNSNFVAGTDATGVTSGTIAGTNSVNVTTDSVKTGYSLTLHPKIEGDYIKIAIKNKTSTLNSLTPYKYDNGNGSQNEIFLKDVSERIFNQTVKLKEGELAIIGGYMYEEKTSNKNGLPFVGEQDNFYDPVTSEKSKHVNKIEIIITISAKVL